MQSGDIVIYKDEVGTVVTDYDNRDIMRFLPCNYGTYSTSRLRWIFFLGYFLQFFIHSFHINFYSNIFFHLKSPFYII